MKRGFATIAGVGLGLAACASLPMADSDKDSLAGCWIERAGEETRTMRWLAIGAGEWMGEAVSYSDEVPPQAVELRLEKAGGALRLCRAFDGLSLENTCTPAFFGRPPGPVAGDRTEIFAAKDRLVMIGRSGARATTIFDGARDGCD